MKSLREFHDLIKTRDLDRYNDELNKILAILPRLKAWIAAKDRKLRTGPSPKVSRELQQACQGQSKAESQGRH